MTGLAVAVLTAAVFLLAPSGGFLGWDDKVNLVAHDAWRGLSPAHLRWMLTTHHHGPWQPLSWLSWALDHAAWGLDPHAFRRTNILLHAVAAGLFTECARLLLPKAKGFAWGAAFAGVFFALHPLRVESVVWLTERRDVLSGAFAAASLLAFLKERRGASLGLFAAALLSKGTAVGMAWVFLFLEKDRRRAWPYFALALGAGLANLSGFGGELRAMELTAGQRAVAVLNSLAFYPVKTFLPHGLSPYYPLTHSLSPLVLLLPALWFLRGHAVAYALILAPVSGVFQAGAQAYADRYSYLACLPFALFVGRFGTPVRVALLASVLSVLTLRQAAFWRDDVSLWTRAVALAPQAYLPRSNLALAFDAAGDRVNAAEQYLWAIKLEPRDVEARVNLGAIRSKEGDYKAAESLYREALALRPSHAPAHFNLAFLLRATGRKDEGLRHLREALRLEPGLAERLPSRPVAPLRK
ncbi:MAG: tetratricopeptide repeat protein [Elusimicrobiota bacterium]|nr:tetratricopeptide repeat protein [Elusimicrobiota bacterium]